MVSQMKQCIKRIETMDKGSDARKDGKQAKKPSATAAGGNAYAVLAGSDDEDDIDVDYDQTMIRLVATVSHTFTCADAGDGDDDVYYYIRWRLKLEGDYLRDGYRM